MAKAALVVTISLGDLEATRLLIWTLWQTINEMRVAGPYTTAYADHLEEALDRYVRTLAAAANHQDVSG
jgi:hypothetical protein